MAIKAKDIQVFEYSDFRQYLQDYYNHQKSLKKNFSYRFFSQKAGFKAPAFLYYIIEGKRNLTKNSLLQVSRAIGHSADQYAYFENLVFFNQATTIQDKAVYYAELLKVRKPLDIEFIGQDRFDYYSKWYHSVVREMITIESFNGDFEKLGEKLIPPISAGAIRDSVKILERLGFIAKDKKGHYTQVTSHVAAINPGPAESFILEQFQVEMLNLAIKSYNNVPRRDRLSTSTTYLISKESFALFQQKAREFRRQFSEIVALDKNATKVYQLTMNFFPVAMRKTDD